MSRHFWVALFVIFVFVNPTVLSSIRAQQNDTLVIGTTFPMDHVSPPYITGGVNDVISTQVFDTLVQYKPGTTEPIPMLATDIGTPSENGLVWTYKLRQGVKFHDGTQFNSTAVAYYYGVIAPSVKAGVTYVISDVLSKVDIVDQYTVRFTLKTPSAAWPDIVATSKSGIPSYSTMKKLGPEEFDRHPVGTGPYKFVSMTERQQVVLEANQDYWGLKDAGLDRVRVNTLIFRELGDSTTLKLAIEKGDIQVALGDIASENYPSLKNNTNLVAYDVTNSNFVRSLVPNELFPPVNKKEVRQALAYAIDYDRIIKVAYKGEAKRAYDFLPPAFLGYKDSFKKYSYDPQKSLSLLKQAGLTTPVKLTLWYQTTGYGPQESDLAVVIADSAKAGGFNIDIQGRDRPTFRQYFRSGNVTQTFLIGYTATYLNTDDFARAFMGSKGFLARVANYAAGDLTPMFPQADQLVNKASAELDRSTRQSMYQQLADLSAEWVPSIPLLQATSYVFTTKNVHGAEFNVGEGDYRFYKSYIETTQPTAAPGFPTNIAAIVTVLIIIIGVGFWLTVRRRKSKKTT